MEEELERDMTPKLIGETWRKYPTKNSLYMELYGLYECQYCGKEFEARVGNIKRKHTKSCGCLKGVNHGLHSNKFYPTWHQMISRCTKPNYKRYKDYGGRGITVCVDWFVIENFIKWAEATHPNIDNYTLDRIDNDKGYSPENCTWSSKTAQSLNRRMFKNNKSGFVGVVSLKGNKSWTVNIRVNKILKSLGTFKTLEEAVQARDNYIIENKLPHKLSTEY